MAILRFKYWKKSIPLPTTPVPYSVYVVEEGVKYKMYPVSGDGTYLEHSISNIGVESIVGDGVDNTDPNNPLVSFPDADQIEDSLTNNKFINQLILDKINSVEQGATQNSLDSELRDRVTHTGFQSISTVTNLQSELDAKATITQGNLADTALQTGDNMSELVNDLGYVNTYVVTESDVTQYESNLNILESQIIGLQYFTPSTLQIDYGFGGNSINWDTAFGWGDHSQEGYLTSFTEQNDLNQSVTWVNVPDVNITQSSVVQHEGSITITESQISDLLHFSGDYNDLVNIPTIGNINQFLKGDGSLDSNSYIEDKNVVSQSSNYTVLPTDRVVLVDTTAGDVTIILPPVSTLDSLGVIIKKIDTSVNTIFIETPNTETIDNLNSREISTHLQARTIITDGVNYWQI